MSASPPARRHLADGGEPELTRRLAKLKSILELTKALTAERRLDRLLARIVDAAARVAEADRCTLFLAEEARRGQVDAALLGVFVEAGVWRETARTA